MEIKDLENQIFNADCLQLMKKIPDKSIDCVITDPPYGLNFDYGQFIDSPGNLKILIDEFMPEFLRIAKSTVIFPGINNVYKYPEPDWICCWFYGTTGNFGKCGYNSWQPLLFYGENNKRYAMDAIKYSEISREKNGHPCPKPLKLMKLIIDRFSNENDLILDPFLGSGTTAIACYDLKRRYIGIEKEPKYFDIAQKRLDQFKAQQRLF
jgi:site-specific DNA-methyltransferase (adenine-specific)